MAAKEIAISKRLKISQAQEYMLLAVLGASIVLGAAAALSIHFVQKIAFNAEAIGAENDAIDAYSAAIESIGVCKKPKGKVYTEDELKKCDPDSIEISEITGTLRANILNELAANPALNAVPKEDATECLNPETEKNYTYEEMQNLYNEAEGEDLAKASDLIKTCSALRVIPDALPAFKNEEALLASLNKIFIMSGWEPESLSPSGTVAEETVPGLEQIVLNVAVDRTNTQTIETILNNIERSIREFDFNWATIEWGVNNTLELKAQATAYYVEPSVLVETPKTITANKEASK